MKGDPSGTPGKLGRGRGLFPLFFFILLSMTVTFPVILSPSRYVIGNIFQYDLSGHIWKLWWFKHSLLHGLPIFYSPLNYYPVGTDLMFRIGGHLDLIFALPFLFILPPLAIYNLFVMVIFLLNGYCTFLLSQRFIPGAAFSILAGVIASVSPFLLNQAAGGKVEEYSFFSIPLFLLFFLKTLEGGRPFDPILAGLFFSLSGISFLLLPIFNLMIALFFLFIHVIKRGFDTRTAGRLLIACAVSISLLGPYFVKFRNSLETASWEGGIFGEGFPSPSAILRSVTPYYGRGADPAPEGEERRTRIKEIKTIIDSSTTVNPGKDGAGISLFLLFLSVPVSSLFFRDTRRGILPLFILAISALILSMGPYLKIDDRITWGDGHYLPLPYILFHRFFPLFSLNRFPDRFLLLFYLFMGICFAKGCYRLSRPVRKVPPPLFSSLFILLYLAGLFFRIHIPELTKSMVPGRGEEVRRPLFIPLSRAPGIHDFYTRIKGEGDMAVIEFPREPFPSRRSVHDYYYQIHHGRPLLFGMGGPFHPFPEWTAFVKNNTLVHNLMNWQEGEESASVIDPLDVELLMESGFRFVVLHGDYLDTEMGRHTRAILTHLFGSPEMDDSASPALYIFDLFEFREIAGERDIPFVVTEEGIGEERVPLVPPPGIEGRELVIYWMERGRWNEALRALGGVGDEGERSWLEGEILLGKGEIRGALKRFLAPGESMKGDVERQGLFSRVVERWCGDYRIDGELCRRARTRREEISGEE